MTEAEYQHALQLLEAAITALQRRRGGATEQLRDEVRRLALELDLLRAQIIQAPAESRRN
jgi:hypothetical protein